MSWLCIAVKLCTVDNINQTVRTFSVCKIHRSCQWNIGTQRAMRSDTRSFDTTDIIGHYVTRGIKTAFLLYNLIFDTMKIDWLNEYQRLRRSKIVCWESTQTGTNCYPGTIRFSLISELFCTCTGNVCFPWDYFLDM